MSTVIKRLATVVAASGLVALLPLHASADQPTLDDLLDLGSPEEQREAVRDAADEPRDEGDERDALDRVDELEELDESLRQLLERDRPADVFAQAVREMADVSDRLGRHLDAGIETQRAQQSILDKLDQVIAAAQQQQDGDPSGGSSDSSPSQQDADSGADDPAQSEAEPEPSPTNGGADDLTGDQPAGDEASPADAQDAELDDRELRELRREWGNLPPRLREEIAEGMNERYSPVYRALTEAYYRKLADEQ